MTIYAMRIPAITAGGIQNAANRREIAGIFVLPSPIHIAPNKMIPNTANINPAIVAFGSTALRENGDFFIYGFVHLFPMIICNPYHHPSVKHWQDAD
ncbi:MAG: hypothetical protein R3E39_00755 [Anaerolineae bacterium]